ncbi:MAG: hypothetical protein ACP5RH_15780, partial [Leptodesmis sp.]
MKLRLQVLRRSLQFLLLTLLMAIAIVGFHPVSRSSPVPNPLPPSQYSSTVQAPFNQPSYYPAAQAPPSNLYRPVGDWVGRLILPSEAEYQQVAKDKQETDWAWLEVYAAPVEQKALIGKTVRLGWTQDAIAWKLSALHRVRCATAEAHCCPETAGVSVSAYSKTAGNG